MLNNTNFITLCILGFNLIDDIDDFIDKWHESESSLTLHEYLGMTHDEYKLWLEKPESLKFIIFSKKNNTPIKTALQNFSTTQLAARASSNKEALEIIEWLKKTNRL
ncbi:MAG: hypothetical protein KA146_09360 [Leptospiraceae bacterium]|nr:hypothetical protein [Leptospiraceae bacterium]